MDYTLKLPESSRAGGVKNTKLKWFSLAKPPDFDRIKIFDDDDKAAN